MNDVDQQLHGYRQGHQLLSSTIRLPKPDQDLVDRLSDVAGPLGPGERFLPYLTLYPLPSGTHYVVARTWQDYNAPRAGCVRTRSLLVPMATWERTRDVAGLVEIATQDGADKPAERVNARPTHHALTLLDARQGVELIEALFLEDRAPIVVFDAEKPEALAVRLTTALWPGFRRTFSMSTFARSPRTIDRRNFDLIFAPKEARSRFSDWPGRRIDGRKGGQARHPWSEIIISHVLESADPSLEGLDVLGEMASDKVGSETALRVSLLWNDLRSKLPASPTAALGMLDIVNALGVKDPRIARDVEKALTSSINLAVATMPTDAAWKYVATLIQKLDDRGQNAEVLQTIASAAYELTSRDPTDTLAVLPELDIEQEKVPILLAVANGLCESVGPEVAESLRRLDGAHLLDLLLASKALAEKVVTRIPDLASVLALALRSAHASVRSAAKRSLLPLFVEDVFGEAAGVLIGDLDVEGLIDVVNNAYRANRLSASTIRRAVVEQAARLEAKVALRDAVVAMGSTAGSDALIEATLSRSQADLDWVFEGRTLDEERRGVFVRLLLGGASSLELRTMLSDNRRLSKALSTLDAARHADASILSQIGYNVPMPDITYISLVLGLTKNSSIRGVEGLVARATELALPMEPSDVSLGDMVRLLTSARATVNGSIMMRVALQKSVSPAAASRNLVAFSSAPLNLRRDLLLSIDELARCITLRASHLDVSEEAISAAATLLEESEAVTSIGHLRAAATLLPFVLEDPREVASLLIGSSFPPVYKALAKDAAFDVISYVFLFLDWDKCKSARRTLAEAFARSDWRASVIAAAAMKAGDPLRILRRIARQPAGKKKLEGVRDAIGEVPSEFRGGLTAVLEELGLASE